MYREKFNEISEPLPLSALETVVSFPTMKTRHTLFIVAAIAALPTRAADERVSLDQLPAPVRQTLDASRLQDPVKKISRRIIDGRTVYIVEIDRNNAPNPHLRIAEDGSLLREPVTPYVSTSDMPIVVPETTDGSLASSRLQLTDVPHAVQQTARSEAKGREIADIDHEMWNGRPVYEIEYKERGLNSRIYVADDGIVVRDERPARSLKSLYMGTQIENTPAAVQDTIRRVSGVGNIADIDKEGTNTMPVYRVEIREAQGTRELRIAQDGTVLHDSQSTQPKRN
jgi:uncharacterized membrane protein YkoI